MKRSQLVLAVCALAAVGCSSNDDPKSSATGGSGGSSSNPNPSAGSVATGGETPGNGVPDGPGSGPCDLKDAVFCDKFDKASPGGRGGDLDETVWSTARVSAKVNPSQGELVSWPSTTLSACGKMTTGVFPDQDTIFCKNPANGRNELTSVFDDANGPAFHSLRVLQPFDFADRLGHITVDIDAKTRTPEGHGWWWEIVIADEPVPVPYQEFVSHALMAHKAIVIEFEGVSSFDGTTNELSHVFVEDGYKYSHEFSRDEAHYVAIKTKEEVMNHIEVLIGKDTLEVYATDLDDMSTFRRVGRVDNLGLAFTRGYVSLQHSQYNAQKAHLDGFVTYHIGSFGFDGPKLTVPRSYQVPDAMADGRTADVKNLGYQIDDDSVDPAQTFNLDGIDLTDATEARINLNAWYFTSERSIQFRLNGGDWRTYAHPFPESMAQTRAVTMPVDLADLVAGANTIEMRSLGKSSQPPLTVANVELEVVPK